ncbi:MAG TPA: FCD domain-containing protein, partial [Burkholderiaceae bacterium]|nr:FCD domain-containing protein [Burkholderiaceae bacterium]
ATHWSYTQRAMAEVLTRDQTPRDIWDQHEAILNAVIAGDGRRAEALARQHITQAAGFMVRRLREEAARAEQQPAA